MVLEVLRSGKNVSEKAANLGEIGGDRFVNGFEVSRGTDDGTSFIFRMSTGWRNDKM